MVIGTWGIPTFGEVAIVASMSIWSAVNGEEAHDRGKIGLVRSSANVVPAVPEEFVGELECLITEGEEKDTAVDVVRVGVVGECGTAVRLPNNEGRPPVEGDVCKDDGGGPPLSLMKWREPTIPYATPYH